jgi:O-antigen/teichoic acid export membrane protein
MALRAFPRTVGADLKKVATVGVVRLVALPVAALFAFATTRLLVGQLGPEAFGLISLIVSLSALLPFADLGVGAAVVNAVAQSSNASTDAHVARVVLTSLRGLLASAAVIATVSVGMGLAGVWAAVLGVPPGTTGIEGAVVGSLVLFALGLPVSVGQRVLLGAGRTTTMVLLQSLGAPLTLAITWCVVSANGGLMYLAWCGPSAVIVVALATTVAADRLTGIRIWPLYARITRAARFPGASVRKTSIPMVVVTLGIPLALQTDRIVLAHRSTLRNLAEYAVAYQMYVPLWSVLATAGTALWPIFARRRQRSESPGLISAQTLLVGMAVLGFAALLVAGPLGAQLLTDGKVDVGLPLLFCFGLLLTVQAAQLPLGMFLMTESGLRFQAVCVCAMVPVSVGIAWWLAGPLGTVGPVVASVVAVAGCQFLPGLIRVHTGKAGIQESDTMRI